MSFVTAPDGARLRVSDRGDGPGTIVLVHGWKGSHRLWDKTAVALMARHRVVAVDLRGMGESHKPQRGEAYDFDVLADDLGHVLAALELDDVTLVGWSMGCTVALRHMERGGARVGRLVLTNGPLRLTRAPDFPHAMPADQLDGYLAALADAWPAGERAFQRESLLHPPAALVDFLYAIALQTPLDAALAIVRAQAAIDHRAAVAALAVPVLALYADRDPYYPTSLADWIAEHAPDGQRTILRASAHCAPLEEPASYAAAIEAFVASRPPVPGGEQSA